MKKGKTFTVRFRREREGRTHYKKRMKLLLSSEHRLVVRKSLNSIHISIVGYSAMGDKILLTVNSKSLAKLGWKGNCGNIPSAYLAGIIAGKKAIEKGIKNAILDLGSSDSVKGSRAYAALAGALEAGLAIPHNPEVLPSKDRVSGEHIAKYAQSLKEDKQRYSLQFSNYIKRGLAPENMQNHFNEIKGIVNHENK